MKTTTMRSTIFSPRHGKALLALIAVCGLAGTSMMPAHAEGNDQRDEHRDRGNHKDQGHEDRGREDRGHEDRRHGDRDRRGYEQPRYYPQPVYAPPAVYYPPQQSAGISLFLPLDIHIR
jgi:hypothetical protein